MRYPSAKVLSNLTNLVRAPHVVGKNVPRVTATLPGKNYSTDNGGRLLSYPALKLEETIPKFLRTVRPLVNDQEYQETESVAKRFMEKDGKDLQALLEKKAEESKNWLAPLWLKAAYMQYRDPVTVFSSPAQTLPVTHFASTGEWLQYTANVINGMAQFKIMIDQGKMPVQKMGQHELDNSQFYRIFGTIRRPARQTDQLAFYPDSKHAVVIYKNHFFKLPILNDECKPISAKVLCEALKSIHSNKKSKGVEYGVLTTDNRDNWAEAYEVLKNIPGNERVLNEIETSLFTVSLDESFDYWSDTAWDKQAATSIHGGGADQNSANRWMDKTIQLVSNRNGLSSLTYEHSPAEGQGIAMIVDFVIEKLKDGKNFDGVEPENFCVDNLQFSAPNASLEQWIETAKRNINKLATDLDIRIYHFEEYGKHFIKKSRFSPDSFIQIALQYAFYRLHSTPGAQYETAHLRIFDGGRTETIRSCSIESVAFAQAMLDAKAPIQDRCEKLIKAVNGHRDYTTNALHGKGVDRHLLGLKLMALENKKPIPELYSTPGFLKSANFRVSTSQVASKNPVFMAYGPITHDGYACCYNPRDNDMILALSCWKSGPETNLASFANTLDTCLKDMKTLCESEQMQQLTQKPKSKL